MLLPNLVVVFCLVMDDGERLYEGNVEKVSRSNEMRRGVRANQV